LLFWRIFGLEGDGSGTDAFDLVGVRLVREGKEREVPLFRS